MASPTNKDQSLCLLMLQKTLTIWQRQCAVKTRNEQHGDAHVLVLFSSLFIISIWLFVKPSSPLHAAGQHHSCSLTAFTACWFNTCDFQVAQCACKFAAQIVCCYKKKMCWPCWSTQACSKKKEHFEVSKLCCKDKMHFIPSSGWHLR